jgi:hypothetical protein
MTIMKMSLQDARIIIGYRHLHVAYRLHPMPAPYRFEEWEWATNTKLKFEIVRYWLAVTTIQRHLPVPLYHHDAYHYIQVGYAAAAGMTFIPFKGNTQWTGGRPSRSVMPP